MLLEQSKNRKSGPSSEDDKVPPMFRMLFAQIMCSINAPLVLLRLGRQPSAAQAIVCSAWMDDGAVSADGLVLWIRVAWMWSDDDARGGLSYAPYPTG